MGALKKLKRFWQDESAIATVVEATILFPIMLMIFAGIVLLSMYLPIRATLQTATQQAATAIATERSDTWLTFDESAMELRFITPALDGRLPNVYASVFRAFIPESDHVGRAEAIVTQIERNSLTLTAGDLTVESAIVNFVVYKEVVVTATRTIQSPVNLSFVGFPSEIPITVTSRAVVANGAEFVRNMDMAVDVVLWLGEEFEGIGNLFTYVREIGSRFPSFFAW